MLISDKLDFKARNIPRGKEGNFVSVKESVHQEDTTAVNIKDSKRIKDYCKQLYAIDSVAGFASPKVRDLAAEQDSAHPGALG